MGIRRSKFVKFDKFWKRCISATERLIRMREGEVDEEGTSDFIKSKVFSLRRLQRLERGKMSRGFSGERASGV